MEPYTAPRTCIDSLERSKQRGTDMRLGTWNVRRLAEELKEKYQVELRLSGSTEVQTGKRGTEPASDDICFFFLELRS